MSIISTVVDTTTNPAYNWLLAATLPPLLNMLLKKRKHSWLQRLLLKRAIKRTSKREHSEAGKFFIKLLVCLGIFGLLLLFLDFGIAAALMIGIGWIVMNVK